MLRTLKNWLGRSSDAPPPLTENSCLQEIATQIPQLYEFIERKYGIPVDAPETSLSLKEFVERYSLPPAQILFVEAQMAGRAAGVKSITAREARSMLDQDPATKLLDVREEWEMKMCRIPESRPLTPELLDELLSSPDRERPLLLYCHFGIRSLDAATFLSDRGFKQVFVVAGGIDAWSNDVDPSIPKYESAYC